MPLNPDAVLAALRQYRLMNADNPTATQLARSMGLGDKVEEVRDTLDLLKEGGLVTYYDRVKTYRVTESVSRPVRTPEKAPSEAQAARSEAGVPAYTPAPNTPVIPDYPQSQDELPPVELPSVPLTSVDRPVLVLVGPVDAEVVELPSHWGPLLPGDQWPQWHRRDGRSRYELWECYEAFTLDSGRRVAMMRPVMAQMEVA